MIIDFVIRAGVVYGVIVATRRVGVWDTPERSQQLYGISRTYVQPYVERAVQRVKMEPPPPPPPQGMRSFLAVHYYNRIVMMIFNFLNMCPTYMHDGLILVPAYVQQLMQRVRDHYEKYQEKRTDEREVEKGSNRRCIDERPLVKPKSKDECDCKTTPADGEKSKDDFMYKPRTPAYDERPNCE